MEESSAVMQIVTVAISATGALTLKEIFDRVRMWQKGIEKLKRTEIDTLSEDIENLAASRDKLKSEKRDLIQRLDAEADLRRRYAEHSLELRRMLIEGCNVPVNDLPPWP